MPALWAARDAAGKKLNVFWPPRRRVKSEPNQTWHADRGY